MRGLFRAFTFTALPLVLAVISSNASAQQVAGSKDPASIWPSRPQRVAPYVSEPEIRTRIEGLLASPGTFLSTDYYRIEMRFGPPVRIDAVVVSAVESSARMLGLRVQVRDDDRARQLENAAYLDLDEIEKFSRAIATMSDLAARWTGRDERRAGDLSFATAGGLRLTIYQTGHPSGRVQRAYLSTGFTEPVTTSFELSDLVALKQAVDQALALLKGK
jgi:hypothetical protein